MNEEETLPKLLDSISSEFSKKDYAVIVINDGSTDQTGSVAESFQEQGNVTVLHNDGNKGLGFTILRGLREAASLAESTDAVVTMDADNTHQPKHVHDMLRQIEKGDDFVIASRFRTGSVVRGVPLARKLLTSCVQLLLRLSTYDPQISEVPFSLRYDRKTSPSKMKVLRTIFETLRLITRERPGRRLAHQLPES